MTATPPSPIRPSLRVLGANPRIGAAKFHGEPLDHLVQRQVQVRLQGDGDLSQRTLVPQTDAAVDLLRGPHGLKFEQALRGLLSTVDGRKGVRNVEGITLATSAEGFGINRALTHIDRLPEHKLDTLVQDSPPGQLGAAISSYAGKAQYSAQKNGTYAQNLSWIDLSAGASRSMLGAIKDGRTARGEASANLVGTLVHELQHAVSPAKISDLSAGAAGPTPLNWLEEGSADVLTWQKPVLRDTAERMGLPYRDFKGWTSAGNTQHAGYPVQRSIITSLLGEAGINVRSRAGIERATDVLQGRSLREVPGKLADEIIANRGLPAGLRTDLRTRIRDLGAVPEGAGNNGAAHHRSMISRARDLRRLIDDNASPEHAA